MWIRSGDIRDQSRKLSEIAQNFGRFFALPNFRGRPSKSYIHFITPTLRHVEWKKFYENTPISPEVLFAHTLNFKPDFKFSRLKFFGGPPSQFGCALDSFGKSLARVKISGHSTP